MAGLSSQEADLEREIYRQLGTYLEAKGFIPILHLKQFRYPTPIGFKCIILSISHYEDCALLEIHLGVRADAVENLAFPFTNGLPGFKKDSLTLVTPLAKLFGKNFERFEIRSKADMSPIISQVQDQLKEKGFSFLQEYSRLDNLDYLYNQNPIDPVHLIHNQVNRCIRGITLARLCQSTEFTNLGILFEQRLKNLYATEPVLDGYQRLLRYLHTYSEN